MYIYNLYIHIISLYIYICILYYYSQFDESTIFETDACPSDCHWMC